MKYKIAKHISIFLGAWFVLSVAMGGCQCVVSTYKGTTPNMVYVKTPPPAAKHEVKPPQPSPNHVWVVGAWNWNEVNDEWEWTAGRWEVPPRGHVWVKATYDARSSGTVVYTPGHWEKADGSQTKITKTVKGKHTPSKTQKTKQTVSKPTKPAKSDTTKTETAPVTETATTTEPQEDTSSEDAKQAGKATSKKPIEEEPKKAGKASSKKSAKEDPKKAGRASSKKPIEEEPKKAGKASSKKPAKEDPKKAGKASSKKPAKEDPKKAGKAVSKEPVEEDPKKAGKNISKKSEEETPKRAGKSTPRKKSKKSLVKPNKPKPKKPVSKDEDDQAKKDLKEAREVLKKAGVEKKSPKNEKSEDSK